MLAVVGVLAALLARTYVVQAFYIPSGSMERTLHGCEGCSGNDRVLVDKVSYRFGSPSRGDIVVFDTKDTPYAQEGGEKDVIKRVIGLPGDVVACCDSQGRVTVNGKSLTEPYVFEDNHASFGPRTVPGGDVWLMGDHRSDSQDSRAVGPIPEHNIVGRAFMRYWPLSRIGLL